MRVYTLDDIPLIMDAEAVAEILDVSIGTVYALIRSRQLVAIRIGKKIRITRDALQSYLKL